MQMFQLADTQLIQSPLNYTGGKYKLLPQILPLFPKEIDCFVDLFCGGCNVGINIDLQFTLRRFTVKSIPAFRYTQIGQL